MDWVCGEKFRTCISSISMPSSGKCRVERMSASFLAGLQFVHSA